MHWFSRTAGAVIAVFALSITSALADDWVASKLRGHVVQLVGEEWLPLARYDVVSDDRVIRTLPGGWVTFQRDEETVELAPNTQIRIHDREGERFTTIEEHFGNVTIEAEVENVQHFAVQTPFLAAVVKGTKFIVSSGETGASVEVLRGAVAVEAVSDHSKTIVKAGQTATVSATGISGAAADGGLDLTVSGEGVLPDVLSETEDLVDDAGNLVDDLLSGLVGSGDNGYHGEGDSGNHGEGDNGNHGEGDSGNHGDKSGSDDDGLVGRLPGRLL